MIVIRLIFSIFGTAAAAVGSALSGSFAFGKKIPSPGAQISSESAAIVTKEEFPAPKAEDAPSIAVGAESPSPDAAKDEGEVIYLSRNTLKRVFGRDGYVLRGNFVEASDDFRRENMDFRRKFLDVSGLDGRAHSADVMESACRILSDSNPYETPKELKYVIRKYCFVKVGHRLG